MTEQRAQFPIVCSLQGGPSEDGATLLVEAIAIDDSVVRFAIPIDNVRHIIAFLLVWVGAISAGQGGGDETDAAADSLPIPATSIAIGAPSGDEGYIGISVGRAELVFSLPISAFGPLGQTLLMAGTPANGPAS
jgi:hypothetical protein